MSVAPITIGQGVYIAKLIEIAQRPDTTLEAVINAWNEWVAGKRQTDEHFRLDLRGFNYALAIKAAPVLRDLDVDADLEVPIGPAFDWSRANLVGACLEGVNLSNALLVHANLSNARLMRANLHFAKLSRASLAKADLYRANLSSADLEGANLEQARLAHANLTYANLRKADLTIARLEYADLSGARLQQANLRGAHLEAATLVRTSLNGAVLSRACLRDANLSWACLKGASLTEADIECTSFRSADLQHASFWNVRYRHHAGLWPFRRNLMLGRYHGIRNAESCHGSALFRRDVLDQDFIDEKYEAVLFGYDWRKKKQRTLRRLIPRLLFELWAFTDYGRSALGVFVYAFSLIAIYGAAYAWWLAPAGAVELQEGARIGLLGHWYAAAMGFATLGLGDLIRARDALGALVMFANVFSGFVFFGMMIAVIQNKFARRA